jgi:hypothetical protein
MEGMIPPLLALLATLAIQDETIHPSRLLVKLREDASPRAVASAHVRNGARLLRDVPQIRWQVIEVPRARLLEVRDAYRAERDVFERADFDRGRKLAYTPNDPYWPGMYHMVMIGADQAWNTQKGHPSVVIGVIDTGLDPTHPDIAANVWSNPGEIGGNGLDDDGNGYIDDTYGYDFAYNDPIPNDVFGHGTQCSGIIAAVQDNFIGVTGVAPLCKVAAIKTAIDSGYLYDSANVPGMIYCADEGFEVISMSFYSDDVTPAERDAIDYCWDHDVLPVAAAGNDARVFPYYPAAYENVIAVAALDTSFNKAWFSNWGTWVDVAAPGLSISTITPGGGYTTGFGGTSGACPHVAGLAALLRGANLSASNATIRSAIENGAIPVVQAPWGEYTGYGRIWAPASLNCLQSSCATTPARFHFMAPCGGGPIEQLQTSTADKRAPWIAYGTHFDLPVNANVLTPNLQPVPTIRRTRNELELTSLSNYANTYFVSLNNGTQLVPMSWIGGNGWHYAPSDAGTSGPGNPVSTGGFSQLYIDDGVRYTCTARSDGFIYVELVLRKVLVPDIDAIELVTTRNYVNTNGTETIEFYDWSTWSFPYGSFVTIASTAVNSGPSSTLVTALPANPARFRDDEGTMYVRLTTSGAASNGRVEIDSFKVIVH